MGDVAEKEENLLSEGLLDGQPNPGGDFRKPREPTESPFESPPWDDSLLYPPKG